MPKTDLPTDLVREYWRKVRDFLVEKHGVARAVAARGVKRFRRRVARAGDAIYNTDPERVAESIQEWTQSATTLIPTPVEISQMPRWAALAFAGRCARRVQPIYQYSWRDAPEQAVELLARGVAWAEQIPVFRPDVLTNGPGIEMTGEPANSAKLAAQLATEANVLPASLAALSAVSAGRGETIDSLLQAISSFMLVATHATPVTRQLYCIRWDFDHLIRLADKHHWTNDTPVPPSVFGPMWPTRLTPNWAREPQRKQEGLRPGLLSSTEMGKLIFSPKWPQNLALGPAKELPTTPPDSLPPS